MAEFFFSLTFFFGARNIFGKNASDIKKIPVTILGKNARDIPDFKIPKIRYYDDFFVLYPWHRKNARDNSQKSARDIEKMPVTNFRNQMSRA